MPYLARGYIWLHLRTLPSCVTLVELDAVNRIACIIIQKEANMFIFQKLWEVELLLPITLLVKNIVGGF